jgi:hypothetical protein
LKVVRVQMITNRSVIILNVGGRTANCPRIASRSDWLMKRADSKKWADVSFSETAPEVRRYQFPISPVCL